MIRHRFHDPDPNATCHHCGRTVPASDMQKGACPQCVEDGTAAESRTVDVAALHTAFRAGVEWACGQGEITEPIRELIDIAAIEYGENPDQPIASVFR
jgi:hypothetical protein